MSHKTDYKNAVFTQRKYRMVSNTDGTVTPVDETEYSQEGDSVGAKELNEYGEALNALENPAFEDYTSSAAPDPEAALLDIISKSEHSNLWSKVKAVLKGVIFKKYMISDADDISALTQTGYIPDATAVGALIRDMDECSLERKEDGVYITYTPPGGADPVSKKLGSTERIVVATNVTNGTYDASSISGYDKMTADNFIFVITSATTSSSHKISSSGYRTGYNPSATANPSVSYDASTGTVTLSGCAAENTTTYGDAWEKRGVNIYGDIYCYPS